MLYSPPQSAGGRQQQAPHRPHSRENKGGQFMLKHIFLFYSVRSDVKSSMLKITENILVDEWMRKSVRAPLKHIIRNIIHDNILTFFRTVL